jgi:hypothetical protein
VTTRLTAVNPNDITARTLSVSHNHKRHVRMNTYSDDQQSPFTSLHAQKPLKRQRMSLLFLTVVIPFVFYRTVLLEYRVLSVICGIHRDNGTKGTFTKPDTH